jgi:hypothetical protein
MAFPSRVTTQCSKYLRLEGNHISDLQSILLRLRQLAEHGESFCSLRIVLCGAGAVVPKLAAMLNISQQLVCTSVNYFSSC